VRVFGSDPSLFYLGGKSGGREVFEKAGVSYPAGSENLTSMDAVQDALSDMMCKRPNATKAMVKLNDGISGEGNAPINLS